MMTLVYSSAINLFICIGIPVLILIGFFSYSCGRRTPPCSVPEDTSLRKEKRNPMVQKTAAVITKKEFPTPWRAKVWTETLPNTSQPSPAEKGANQKS